MSGLFINSILVMLLSLWCDYLPHIVLDMVLEDQRIDHIDYVKNHMGVCTTKIVHISFYVFSRHMYAKHCLRIRALPYSLGSK